MSRPTQEDVARLAGVSRATVSYVLNQRSGGRVQISDETRSRVLAAMQELGYRPNTVARSLRRGETHTIGMIVPDSANPFFAEVARGIEDASFQRGYSVILCNSDGDLRKELVHSTVLAEKQVDGILFVAAGESSDNIRALQARGIPVVVIDRELADVAVDAVLADNERGGWMATRHLLELGHRHIGCITGPSEVNPSAERVTGYRRALGEAGIAVDGALIARGDFQYESGYWAGQRFLSLDEPATAILACNDLMAVGLISAAIERGMHVPEDLSVIGFDDVRLASFANPPLTTVVQPKHEIGVLAVQMLLERLRAPATPPQRRLLETSLRVRQSTAPYGGRTGESLRTPAFSGLLETAAAVA